MKINSESTIKQNEYNNKHIKGNIMKKTLLVLVAFMTTGLTAMDYKGSNIAGAAKKVGTGTPDKKALAAAARVKKAKKLVSRAKALEAEGNDAKALKLAQESVDLLPNANATGNYIVAKHTSSAAAKQKHLELAALSSQAQSESKDKAKQTLHATNSPAKLKAFKKEFRTKWESEEKDIEIWIKDQRKQFPDESEFAMTVLKLKKEALYEHADLMSWIENNKKFLFPNLKEVKDIDIATLLQSLSENK